MLFFSHIYFYCDLSFSQEQFSSASSPSSRHLLHAAYIFSAVFFFFHLIELVMAVGHLIDWQTLFLMAQRCFLWSTIYLPLLLCVFLSVRLFSSPTSPQLPLIALIVFVLIWFGSVCCCVCCQLYRLPGKHYTDICSSSGSRPFER